MTLTLRIDNFDTLEDGGPTFLFVDPRDASVGRKRGMDWVLPDSMKHVSGHHFDITYARGAYFLIDVSTNGTLIEGSPHRLDGPCLLKGGERLLVGKYVISVQVRTEARSEIRPEAPQQVWGGGGIPQVTPFRSAAPDDPDPWDLGPHASSPAHGFPSLQVPSHINNDSAQDVAQPSRSAIGAADIQSPGVPQQSQPVAIPPQFADDPDNVPPGFRVPLLLTPRPTVRPATPPAPPSFSPVNYPPPPVVAPAAPSSGPAASSAFAAAFCEGAGLSSAFAQSVDAEALARTLGQVVRITTDEMMHMLQDRAKVKQFTRGGERTMRSATGNNPMKFMVDSEQAIEVMFLRARDGFMTGPDGFDNALKDLRAHQMAVFAALQPALAAVLAGLSPEEIDGAETAGNMLGGPRKGRLWDQFVRRWDEKAKAGDHGMLDEFLKAFARAYAGVVSRDV